MPPAVIFLVGGCVLANWRSFSQGGTTELGGVIQCLISMLAAALKPVIVKLLTSGGAGMRPCGGACSCLGTDTLCTVQLADAWPKATSLALTHAARRTRAGRLLSPKHAATQARSRCIGWDTHEVA